MNFDSSSNHVVAYLVCLLEQGVYRALTKDNEENEDLSDMHGPTRSSQALVTFVSFCLIDDPTVATSRFAVSLNQARLERMSINYLGRGIAKSHARIVERMRWGMRASKSENRDSIIAEAGYENSTSSKPTPR